MLLKKVGIFLLESEQSMSEHREYNLKYYPDSEISGICGIYQIRNILNGNFYIGSAFDLLDRRNRHFRELFYGKHDNYHLQNAYNCYGKENFIFEVVEFCEPEVKYEVEQKWLDKFFGKEFCYNLNPRASQPPVFYGADNPRAKSIICLDDKNVFGTINDCAKFYNKDRSGIVKNINGKYIRPEKRFTYLNIYNMMLEDGYTDEEIYKNYNAIIKKYDEYIEHLPINNSKFGGDNPRAKGVICLNDNRRFDTLEECKNFYNRDRSGIFKNCTGKYKYPTLKFMFLDMYNKMINDGYDNKYIFDNHYFLIHKYSIDKK